jgi:endonuclease/exonuclease/phosphatase family metal-dependent hydrolase
MLLLCLFCVIGCGAVIDPARERPDREGPPPVRVMSFNVRYGTADDGPNAWPLRKQMLIARIRAQAPDLLGTQEALAEQVEELRQVLPEYGVVGVGRDDGRRAGEFTAVFYRTDRYELLDSGHFWLSPQPDMPGSIGWDAALTRMATWIKLRDKRAHGRDDVLFINTHWDHVGEQARVESAGLIRQRIGSLAAGMSVIFTGDLNCAPTSEACRVLLDGDRPRLIDAYRVIHPHLSPDEATFHAFAGTTSGGRIDFVFHSEDFQPIRASIDRYNEGGRYPSDHFPVVAELVYQDHSRARRP